MLFGRLLGIEPVWVIEPKFLELQSIPTSSKNDFLLPLNHFHLGDLIVMKVLGQLKLQDLLHLAVHVQVRRSLFNRSRFRRNNAAQNRFQRAFNSQSFGVEVTHGGFERTMPHRLLDGTRTDPVFHAVRGVTMTIIPSSE